MNYASLFDVWLNDGRRITVWAISEDDAFKIVCGFGLKPIGAGAL